MPTGVQAPGRGGAPRPRRIAPDSGQARRDRSPVVCHASCSFPIWTGGPPMAHELPPLPFTKNALEPIISSETIDYHYGKHHKAYVDKLNSLIVGTPYE